MHNHMYVLCEDLKYESLDDFYDYYFARYSDDIVIDLFKERIFEIDGRVYAFCKPTGIDDDFFFDCSVQYRDDTKIEVENIVTDGNGTVAWTELHTFIIEDGCWVLGNVKEEYAN